MYAVINTKPAPPAQNGGSSLNTNYNQLPFYYNAHTKEPSDLSSRRQVERNPGYNHLNNLQRIGEQRNGMEQRLLEQQTQKPGEIYHSSVLLKRRAVKDFESPQLKGCAITSTKVLGTLLTTAHFFGCLALLLAIIALIGTGRSSSPGVTNEQVLMREIQQLQRQVETLRENQSALEDTLQNSMSMNAQVDLYQNCKMDSATQECHASEPNLYMTECITRQYPIEERDYYTLSMRCDYEANQFFFETAYLRRSDEHIDCVCKVTNLHYNALPETLRTTCRITIMRCPRSQEIFNQT